MDYIYSSNYVYLLGFFILQKGMVFSVMSDIIHNNDGKGFTLSINEEQDFPYIAGIGNALASVDRIRILKLLSQRPMSISEISETLSMAISSVSYHIDILAESQLVFISYQPGIKGHKKLCSKAALNISINWEDTSIAPDAPVIETVEMPIGNYVECNVQPPCGLAGRESVIAPLDIPQLLFTPKRTAAQLFWFKSGYVTYKFPNYFFQSHQQFRKISFSMELCSETSYYRTDWPSDITFWINGIEIVTITSPGDFGGRRGIFTPEYWFINSTQYGILTEFSIDDKGVYIGNKLVNHSVTFSDLKLDEGNGILFKLGIKPDAVHIGGINLFGKYFGDYPQAIVMTLSN